MTPAEMKKLRQTYKGRTKRPVDPEKLRVNAKPVARPKPDFKAREMPSARSTGRSILGMLENAPEGLADLAVSVPTAAYDYIRTSTPGDVVSDVKSGLSGFVDYAQENPGEAAADVLVGGAKGAGEMLREASLARDAGDEERAAQIEKFAVPMLLGALVPGGRAAAKGKKAAAKTSRALTRDALAAGEEAAAPKPKRSDVVQRKARRITKAKAEGKKIPGAPLGVMTAADEARRRKAYKDTMELGRAGANWYDESGKAILENVGDDPAKARRASEVFSITSSGTGVGPNTGFAVKGMNQASYGDPVVTGRFPTAMGAQIEDLYRGDTAVTGKKRTPFADQLAIGGGFYDPSLTGQGNRGVHDIWDAEAWGYTDAQGRPLRRAFQDAEHGWMDRQMDMVLKDYINDPDIQGLPGRGQAATWTGAKIRAGDISPEDAAYSYADDIARHYAQGSREAVPGSNTGHMQGMLDAPFELRKEYTDEFMPIFFDEKGRDRIALNNDMLVGPAFEGPGVYEGVNAGRQAQYAVGTTKVPVPGTKGADPRIDPASLALMYNNEALFGLLGGQKGIAGHRFYTGVPQARSNALELDVGGRPISYEEGERAIAALERAGFGADDFAVVPSPRGVRAMDLSVFEDDLADLRERDPEMYKVAIKARMERLNKLSDALGTELGGEAAPGFMHSIYAENAWDRPEGALGQQYLQYIFPEGKPQFVERFNAIAPGMAEKLRELDRRTAKNYGFDISSNLDEMRAAIAAEGEAGLRALLRKRGYSKGGAVERDLVNAAGDLGLLAEKYADQP